MKGAGRGLTADRERFGLRRALVVSQVALSLVLLVGALLFVGSLRNLMTLDAGFRQNGLLIAGIDISRLNYPAERRAMFYRDLLAAVRATPGVEQAASATIVQISGSGWNDAIEILGQRGPRQQRSTGAMVQSRQRGLLSDHGHAVAGGPRLRRSRYALVARRGRRESGIQQEVSGRRRPDGKAISNAGGTGRAGPPVPDRRRGEEFEISEPTRDIPSDGLCRGEPGEATGTGSHLVVRSTLPVGALLAALKDTIHGQNAGTSIRFQVFNAQVQDSLLRERLMATLSGFFGLLAAILATVGLYGVISYMVARRRNEIGIRIALGANRGTVIRMILREAGLLVVGGLVIGSVLAIVAARTATSLLYGLKPSDPLIIGLSYTARCGRADRQLHSGTARGEAGADDRVKRGMK